MDTTRGKDELELLRIAETAGSANGWLIRIGDNLTLIDAGLGPDALGSNVPPVRRVFLTHVHYDHIAAIDAYREQGAKIYASQITSDWLRDPEANLSGWFGQAIRFRPADYILEEGSVVRLDANWSIGVWALPGHSPGDLVYRLLPENRDKAVAIFSGDFLFSDSVGRTDLPGGDVRQQQQSLRRFRRLLELEDDQTPVCPGHGREIRVERLLRGHRWLIGL
ncbi:MAG: MBL fold metallo-hydrolase [Bacillota bacterium]|nr:MBL fold metallo-hydrolase [Bacillota bacterium]